MNILSEPCPPFSTWLSQGPAPSGIGIGWEHLSVVFGQGGNEMVLRCQVWCTGVAEIYPLVNIQKAIENGHL